MTKSTLTVKHMEYCINESRNQIDQQFEIKKCTHCSFKKMYSLNVMFVGPLPTTGKIKTLPRTL